MSGQLQLQLSDRRTVVPWDGRSPRDLTRGRMLLFSRREPQKPERFFIDGNQGDLFPAAIRGPLEYRGAPLLVPLK